MGEEDFCGCCGNVIPDDGIPNAPLWCLKCAAHLGPEIVNGAYQSPWDRTFEAVNGEPCPFQVGSTTNREAP